MTLKNPRHERFAQEIVKGKTATEVMAQLGYSDPRNSTQLKKNPEIQRRIAELQAAGAERAEITVASLLAELDAARKLALELGQCSAAVSAIMGMAKLTGLIIDRREIGQPGEFDHLTDAELMAKAARDARELGIAGPNPH